MHAQLFFHFGLWVVCEGVKWRVFATFQSRFGPVYLLLLFSKSFSKLHYTWLTASILCTAFHKLAVYFYFRNIFLYYESISVCGKMTTDIVSGWWDYRWFLILFFWLICTVWLYCSEYVLPTNRDIIKAVLKKIQFH